MAVIERGPDILSIYNIYTRSLSSEKKSRIALGLLDMENGYSLVLGSQIHILLPGPE